MKEIDIEQIIHILKETYPDAKCSLDFEEPFQLVVAVMLSAQCTDERVNQVTPILFKKCKRIEDFLTIKLEDLEEIIHSCGFYKNKAKNIQSCARQILEEFGGEVPYEMEKLLTLSGVGRKSANVIQLEVFGKATGIAVDTHCKRISNRLGLSSESDPSKIEQDLLKIIDAKYLKDVNHLLIWHGRYTCTARNPKCSNCVLKDYCPYDKL